MIVVVEGIDRVGKTTLCNKLVNAGFVYFKDPLHCKKDLNTEFSYGKLDTSVTALKVLDKKRLNVVVDRLHLTEQVYGSIERTSDNQRRFVDRVTRALIKELSEVVFIWVRADDVAAASERAGKNLRHHEEKFREEFTNLKCELIRKKASNALAYEITFNRIDETVRSILTRKKQVYFASPFFNEHQVEREERMKKKLRALGFSVYSPKEEAFLKPTADQSLRQKVFDDNCDAIRRSMFVFAVTDEKDMGTIWEAGYAYGIGIPVLYFAETLGQNQFNLMLAQSGKRVFTSQEQVTQERIYQALFEEAKAYEGVIE